MNYTKVTMNINELATLGAEIWYECFPSIISKEQIDYMLNKFQSEKAISAQIEKENFQYYFIGEKLGYFGFYTKENTLFLSKFYIKASQRGKGLGRGVINFLENYAHENGLKKIQLTVNKNNTSAINAYKHWGFEVIKEAVFDIGEGYVMDDFVMEKATSPQNRQNFCRGFDI